MTTAPSASTSFVRYLPPVDGYEPQAHTQDENLDRLFRNWGDYLRSYDPRPHPGQDNDRSRHSNESQP
jgi:hypothetical protein